MKSSDPRSAAAEAHASGYSKGYVAVFGTIIIWSTPSLFLFYLNRYYDPFAQNFYRYAIACLAVMPLLFWSRDRGPKQNKARLFRVACLPAIPNAIHQITGVVALSYIGPGVFTVFMRSSVIMTALLALFFFPEERAIIRQWRFQIGTLFGLLGAIGVLCFAPGFETGRVALRGSTITFTAAFCWSLYGVFVKRPSSEFGPVRSFAAISFFTSLLLFAATLAFGNLATPAHVAAKVNFILVFSAITCITLAHLLYYVAIRELGVALSQTLQLLCPLFALILSYFIYGERLSAGQMASAALLLVGAFLAMQVKPTATAETAENL